MASNNATGATYDAPKDVDWIEAFQNYVRLHAGGATYLLHVPMNTIEGVLDSKHFLRIHRSHIVNVRRNVRTLNGGKEPPIRSDDQRHVHVIIGKE